MREPTYYILTALTARGTLHGYAIAEEAAKQSKGNVKITAGTLYGALDRLVDQGMIEVDREETVDGRRRRCYRITKSGEAAVQNEVIRMRVAIDAANNSTRLPLDGLADA